MLLKHRRGMLVANTRKEVQDLVACLRHFEQERLIRLLVNQATFHLPIKLIADATGCTVSTFEKTIKALNDAVSDLNREIK